MDIDFTAHHSKPVDPEVKQLPPISPHDAVKAAFLVFTMTSPLEEIRMKHTSVLVP